MTAGLSQRPATWHRVFLPLETKVHEEDGRNGSECCAGVRQTGDRLRFSCDCAAGNDFASPTGIPPAHASYRPLFLPRTVSSILHYLPPSYPFLSLFSFYDYSRASTHLRTPWRFFTKAVGRGWRTSFGFCNFSILIVSAIFHFEALLLGLGEIIFFVFAICPGDCLILL